MSQGKIESASCKLSLEHIQVPFISCLQFFFSLHLRTTGRWGEGETRGMKKDLVTHQFTFR